MDRRDEFLIAMYNKMWDNIDRHIHVVWQSVGVLAGSITALVLVEKEVFSLDFAVMLVVMVGVWQVAHVLDASWWFNRNLLIIANIEKQFMRTADEREIHYYFLDHRKPSMLDHQKIQLAFGGSVTVVVLIYHFIERILPGLGSSISYFDSKRALPYCALGVGLIVLRKFYKHHLKAFNELKRKSPGKVLT